MKDITDDVAESIFESPLDITVLMGGPSSERQVSIMSGEALAGALESRGHKVSRADINPHDTSALDRSGIDVVFVALHGEFGESGDVQRLCEQRGLCYTGSGPRASELAMDKAASKQIFKRAGLATPDWMVIENFHAPEDIQRWLSELPLPMVVKPLDAGSSVDITIAHDEKARSNAMEEVIDRYGRCMVEKYVPGREVTVGILVQEALPVLEVVPDGDFYDYFAKYDDSAGTRYVFDNGIDEALCRKIQQEALVAHRALECRDMSRVDFVLDDNMTPQVLEINTIPGFTGHSLLPMAAARAGISFGELTERIVAEAMKRKSPNLKQTVGYR